MTEQKKPIAERLRGWGNGGTWIGAIAAKLGLEGDAGLPHVLLAIADEIDAEKRAIIEAQDEYKEGFYLTPHQAVSTYAQSIGKPMKENETITEWLDRWYLERPLFNNGEPVQFEDEVEGCQGRVNSFEIFLDGSGHVAGDNDCYGEGMTFAQRAEPDRFKSIKRPAPLVLDAEGMPLKRYERVWDIESGKPYTVEGFANREAGMVQCCDAETGDCEDINASQLTHYEPDGIQRVISEMNYASRGTGYQTNCSVRNWASRLSALIERGQ